MLRLAADENFNNDIIRGLVRRKPDIDIIRIQDVGLSGAADPMILEWAAGQGRVLVTHDVSTLTPHAYDRWSSLRNLVNGTIRSGASIFLASTKTQSSSSSN